MHGRTLISVARSRKKIAASYNALAFCATAWAAYGDCVSCNSILFGCHNKNIRMPSWGRPGQRWLRHRRRVIICRNWPASSAQSRSAACFSRSRSRNRKHCFQKQRTGGDFSALLLGKRISREEREGAKERRGRANRRAALFNFQRSNLNCMLNDKWPFGRR